VFFARAAYKSSKEDVMTDLDNLLADVGGATPDPRLEGIDAAVLAGVGRWRERVRTRRSLALTGVVALGIGLSASLVSPQGAQAEPMSLNAVPAIAPSSLLLGAH
jgi:hypothetical protein